MSVLRLDGELDVQTVPAVRESAKQLLGPGKALVVDLAKVRFCGCAGLSLFLDWQATAQATGGSFRIAAASPAVRRLMAVADLAEAIPMDTDSNTAVRVVTGERVMPADREAE